MEDNIQEKEKTHFYIGGQSNAAGVCFYCDDLAAFAQRKEDGSIKLIKGSKKKVLKALKKADDSFPASIFPLLFDLVFLTIAITSIYLAVKSDMNIWKKIGVTVFWLPSWWSLGCIFVAFTSLYKDKQDLLRFKQYHGAEHKVYNAYHKNYEIPDEQYSSGFSILCPACGCAYQGAIVFFMAIVGLLISFAPQIGFWKILIILFVVFIYIILALSGQLSHPHPFMVFEIPATAQPSLKQQEVACAAFKGLYDLLLKQESEKATDSVGNLR